MEGFGVLVAWLLVCTSWLCMTDAVVPDGCDGSMDLVFVLDHSESIRDNDPPNKPNFNWYHYTNFTKRIIQNLPVQSGDTRVGVVKFGTEAKLEFNMDKYTNSWDIQNAVAQMSYDGGKTNTFDALRMTTEEVFYPYPGDRPSHRNVIVLMTDGMSNVNQAYTVDIANSAKAEKIEIFTIGITHEVDAGELGAIATDERHYIHVSKFDKLEDYIRLVTHRVCGLPDPTPPSERPDGSAGGSVNEWGCVEHCEECSEQYFCERCEPGWYWSNIQYQCQECEMRMDLCFLIDVSGSITDKNPDDESYDNYELLKQFIKDMIDLLDVGPDDTRIGAVKFSDKATLLFNLDTFTTQQDMKDVIEYMSYDGGHTNTSGGIRLMRSSIYRRERGDRADARNVAVLITDGESTYDSNFTIPEANLAKEAGTSIFVIGITNDINEAEAKAVASDPDSEYYINITDIRSLRKVKEQLIKVVCNPESPIRRARSVEPIPHVLSKRSYGSDTGSDTDKKSSAPLPPSSLLLIVMSVAVCASVYYHMRHRSSRLHT